MEVHHHPDLHHKKKNFKEYFLEFIMIFLAVFLGFVAENIRENMHNKETEKNNIESLIKNLRDDSLSLLESIDVNEKRFTYFDSLLNLKNSKIADSVFNRQFFFYDLKLGYLDYFESNQSTFDQMQSSGSLRLISHPGVLDRILVYEVKLKKTKRQEDVCSDWWNKSIEQVSSNFDLTILAHLPPDALWKISLDEIKNIPLPDIKKHLQLLQTYFNWQVNERIALGYYINFLHELFFYNGILISFLQKEYHLK